MEKKHKKSTRKLWQAQVIGFCNDLKMLFKQNFKFKLILVKFRRYFWDYNPIQLFQVEYQWKARHPISLYDWVNTTEELFWTHLFKS